jgi:hypothetical protein
MQLRRLLLTSVTAAVAATSLSACGTKGEVSHGRTEGPYVTTGQMQYQVQISRILNPFDFEDRDYLKGVANFDSTLAKNEQWFGIFIRAFNHTNAPHASARRFFIVDTTGQRFEAVRVDPDVNVVAYRPLVVGPGDQIPVPGSLARENATQGGLVLYKIPEPAFANRPLELHIESPAGGPEATVDLDI